MKKLLLSILIIILYINSNAQSPLRINKYLIDSLTGSGYWYLYHDSTHTGQWGLVAGSGGGGGGSGTVTSITQAYGIINTPNPLTTTGTIKFDSATVFPQLRATIPANTDSLFGVQDNSLTANRSVNGHGTYGFKFDSLLYLNYRYNSSLYSEIALVPDNPYEEAALQDQSSGFNYFRTAAADNSNANFRYSVGGATGNGNYYISGQSTNGFQKGQFGSSQYVSGRWIDYLFESEISSTTVSDSHLKMWIEQWDGSSTQRFTNVKINGDSTGWNFLVWRTFGSNNNGSVGTGYKGIGIDTAADITFHNYPSSRNDGMTTKAAYFDANGKFQYGYLDTTFYQTKAATKKTTDSVVALIGGGGTTWNGITDPTGDQALTFQAGESSTWTDQNTTEDLFTVNSSTGTTNSMFSLNRTGTALAAGNNIMEIVSSGANGTSSITATGLRISVTNTGTTSTNTGITIAASGASSVNQAIEVTAGQTILPAGSSTVPSLKIGGSGLLEVSNGIGVFGSSTGHNINIAGGGLIFKSTTAVIDIGQSSTFGTTNQIRISTTAEGAIKFSTIASTAAVSATLTAGESTASSLLLIADEGDDAADTWTLASTTGNLLTFTNTAQTLSLSTNGSLWSVRDTWKQGADVASVAGAIAVGTDGNSFELTGTNAVTLISNLNWQNGAIITFLFTSTATLTDGTANSGTDIGMELAGNTNFVGSAGATLTLLLSEIGGTQRWREIARSVQ